MSLKPTIECVESTYLNKFFNKDNIIIRELTKTRQRYIWGAEYLPQIDGG
jgi:hypothetical protein